MLFRVLGPVDVVHDGRHAPVGTGRRRTILAVLLAARTTVPTDRLIDAVWDGRAPPSARKSLQSHVARLRAALGEPAATGAAALRTDGDGYRLHLDAHEVDADRFEHQIGRAREVTSRDPAGALDRLQAALAAWRGPAFGDLAGTPLVRTAALRLERLRAVAQAASVDARLALGDHGDVVGELEATVATDPLDEQARGQLVVALCRSGRQADALAVYRSLHDRLREELGVDPSPALQDLHERVLRHDPDLMGPPRWGTEGGRQRAATTFAPDLVGRDDAVATVVEMVDHDRLITLTGPGGVGKTRVAQAVADRLRERLPDGVVTCELAGVRDPGDVGWAMVTALGIRASGDPGAGAALVAGIGDRQILVVVDNCEHVLEAVAPLVDHVLAGCPAVTVLATSRERLHLPGERVVPVAPLVVPAPGADLAGVTTTPAGALFVARAGAAEPAFRLTDANASSVGELCRRLDGMPLAIELAASRVRAIRPQDLVDRLDQRFSLLAGGPHRVTGRHRTLRAVVAWSYDLLEPDEQELFDRLSVFAGTFALDDAEQVCAGGSIAVADVAGLLGELVDKSMVAVDRQGDAVRYRLLDTLRDFGSADLRAAGTSARFRRSHAAHHLRIAEDAAPRLRGRDELVAAARLDAAIDDLRAVHTQAVADGEVDQALRLPGALGDHLFCRLRDEITTWARRALAMDGAEGHPLRPRALATAAKGSTSRGECERARREARTVVAAVPAEDLAHRSALEALGTADLYDGRLEEVLVDADRLDAAADIADDAYASAFAGVLRVLARSYLGDVDAAVTCADDLRGMAARIGNATMQAFADYCHGEANLDADQDAAAASLQRAVAQARAAGNALVEGVSTVSLASLLGRRGAVAEALPLFRDVVAHWQRLGDYTHQLTTVRNLVELLADVGADEAAAQLHGAVTDGLAPSFGAEARRLERTWDQVEGRLGTAVATRAAARGRSLSATAMGEVALAHIDVLLDR